MLASKATYRKLVGQSQDPDMATMRQTEWQNITQDLLRLKTLSSSDFESLQRVLRALDLREDAPAYCHVGFVSLNQTSFNVFLQFTGHGGHLCIDAGDIR